MLASSRGESREAADPEAGERVVDLGQAKEAIDLLSLLRVKTEGNRTEQESHLSKKSSTTSSCASFKSPKGKPKGAAGA